ncbi:MAG: helix-turn-helix domain-containing protein [Aeromicrobium sp.]
MEPARSFVELLHDEAPREAFDEVLAELSAVPGAGLDTLRAEHATALRLREQMARQRHREAELSALYDTANDLTGIRDVDAILAAIVRRARQLLNADMTYLSLNDEGEGASYMRVTDGSVSAEFRNLRLPLGAGLLGLVAQIGAPYYTDDYRSDPRFQHHQFIDSAVDREGIRAILGVPLLVNGRVIGALLATHRKVRRFPPAEVTLLTSFAAHAAIALENARLFEKAESALAEVDKANRQIRAHAASVEAAASAHDRLTDVLLQGGGVKEVAEVLADLFGGSLVVLAPDGRLLEGIGAPLESAEPLDDAVAEARRTGRSVKLPGSDGYVAAVLAGSEHLGTLVLHALAKPLDPADRRTVERGALVTALVLLFARSVAEAEERVHGELVSDLITGRHTDASRLRERARRHRVDLDQVRSVVAASVDGLDRHRGIQLTARLAGELHGLGGEQSGRLVLVAPGEPLEVGRQLQETVNAAGGTATVGVAPTGPGANEVSVSFLEASRCLTTLLTLGRAGEVSDATGLGLAQLVLGQGGPGELDAFITSLIGPLLDYDARRGTALVETLDAWFASGTKPAEAAKILHVHPNTIAQRLERIGKLIDPRWRESSRALDLQFALRLWRLRT